MTQKQNIYRHMLDCPMCGDKKTRFVFNKSKMVCEKCGNEWEKPQKPQT